MAYTERSKDDWEVLTHMCWGLQEASKGPAEWVYFCLQMHCLYAGVLMSSHVLTGKHWAHTPTYSKYLYKACLTLKLHSSIVCKIIFCGKNQVQKSHQSDFIYIRDEARWDDEKTGKPKRKRREEKRREEKRIEKRERKRERERESFEKKLLNEN